MEDPNRSELEIDLTQVDQSGRPIGTWLCCLPCDWLKRNNSFHKVFLTIATLLVTVLLVASPVLFLISSIPGDKSKDCNFQNCAQKEEKICKEAECLVAANRILASISWTANPCQDFYNFACGSWKSKKVLAKKRKFDSEFQENSFINFETLQQNVDETIQRLLSSAEESGPFQKLGLFYKSCVNTEEKRISLFPLLSLLDNLGGYVEPSSDPPEDLTELILNLFKINGVPLFDIYVDVDPHNTSKLIPVIDLPLRFGFNFPSRYRRYLYEKNFLEEFPFETEVISKLMSKRLGSINEAYNFIKAKIEEKRLIVMERIMQEFMSGNMSQEEKIKERQNTLLFANTITKVYPREKDVMRNYQGEVNTKMKIKDLKNKYPFIRWLYMLDNSLNAQLSDDDFVILLAPGYLNTLQQVLSRFSSRIIHNGILLIYATDTLYQLVNTSSTNDWPAYCTKLTTNLFSKPVSVLYVRQYGSEYLNHLRSRVSRVFNNLKETFKKRVQTVPWLDDRTRGNVFQKLSTLKGQFLAWPNFWNSTYASSLMDDANIDPEDFFGNVIRRFQELRKVPVSYKQHQTEEKLWAYPFVINAFYILTLNTIIIPLAVLTQPFFRDDVPLYVPYSTIGLILAHEILHGFDLRGIGYDLNGNPSALLSTESRNKFEARLDCFVKQFSTAFLKKVNFLGAKVDVQFDWNMTKNENMADISGLQIAYEAWKDLKTFENEAKLPGVNLNTHQLFFLIAAQTYCSVLSPADYIFLVETDFHTPQPERVNGIMMNSPGFAEAFSCPLGSPMNPKKKCSTW